MGISSLLSQSAAVSQELSSPGLSGSPLSLAAAEMAVQVEDIGVSVS